MRTRNTLALALALSPLASFGQSYNLVYDTRDKELGACAIVQAKNPWHDTFGIKGLTSYPGAYAGAYFSNGNPTAGVELSFPLKAAREADTYLFFGIGIKNSAPFSFSFGGGMRF
jgi:hypothetical protein